VRTTFFVIGNKLLTRDARACTERAHAEGHWIGNHTWTHSRPLGERPGAATADLEIGRTQAEIGVLSHSDRLFRPTGGGGHLDRRLLSPDAAALLKAGGYTCVLWNAIPRDWDDPDGWADRALEQCRSQPWSLMVLHDLPSGAMNHLEDFIDRAAQAGARFRQEFPPECIPIRSGKIVQSIELYVSSIEESA
jgi:peptidoglycan/xylan/chitin deacetylase (PgdA/CDA1 family)